MINTAELSFPREWVLEGAAKYQQKKYNIAPKISDNGAQFSIIHLLGM